MIITDFINRYKNHPVLFVGTGLSLRYIENSYNWDSLLGHIAYELKENTEYYLDIKSRCQINGKYKLEKVASLLEEEFNRCLIEDRNGKFKHINDLFYEKMRLGQNVSRFKLYISDILSNYSYKTEKIEELAELKKIRKNISSIITTNYDRLIEDTFEFNPLVGNNILLSNPYGSVYKIHGCVSDPEKIIITNEDYLLFDGKYELIRAQLLSLFIHNPIIFLGYNIGDENIKNILKTIFTYVEPNSTFAQNVRNNFLLVEYDEGSTNLDVTEHDIDLEGYSTIRINKIKTDNYIDIYKSISAIHLPITAMDIRKVQSVVKEIYTGGNIKVTITEDLDTLNNGDKILVIGSNKTISYQYQTVSEMISNYFSIIDESNIQILTLIDKYTIQRNQYFPIFGFSRINDSISKASVLKNLQEENLNKAKDQITGSGQKLHCLIEDIMEDDEISNTNKELAIFWNLMEYNISLNLVEQYLRNYVDKKSTNFRKILCAYDYLKYGD